MVIELRVKDDLVISMGFSWCFDPCMLYLPTKQGDFFWQMLVNISDVEHLEYEFHSDLLVDDWETPNSSLVPPLKREYEWKMNGL